MGKINPALEQLIKVVRDNPNTYTFSELAALSGLTYDQVTSAIRRGREKYILQVKPEARGPSKQTLPKRTNTHLIPNPPNTEHVLVIGDLHEPFTLQDYREFCYDTYKKYKCTHVVFIGDIIDNHYASYHETDPDGMGGGAELDKAIDNIAEWVKMFPKADVTIGNHDRLIMRKAFSGSIPRRWVMDYQDVLGAPGWHFRESALYDGIHYIHGEGATARTRARKDLCSTVQGHRHPEAYTEWIVGETFKIFGMQVGCGVDRRTYAMGYAKDHPKPAIAAGLILNHGELATNVLMKL